MKSLGNLVSMTSLTLSNGTSFVTITAPPTGTYILALPQNIGTPGQVLKTNGFGSTYWDTAGGGGGGGLTSVGLTSSNPFLVVTGSPLTANGAISIDIGTLPISKGNFTLRGSYPNGGLFGYAK